jgi:hypothetical protein
MRDKGEKGLYTPPNHSVCPWGAIHFKTEHLSLKNIQDKEGPGNANLWISKIQISASVRDTQVLAKVGDNLSLD